MIELYSQDGSLNAEVVLENARILYLGGAEAQDYVLVIKMLDKISDLPGNMQQVYLLKALCLEKIQHDSEAQKNYMSSIAYEKSLEAFEGLARICMRQGQDAKAADYLLRALSLNILSSSQRLNCYQAIGNCFLRSGDVDQAERYYKIVLNDAPDRDDVRSNLGVLQLQKNQPHLALPYFQEALSHNPRNRYALTGLGVCYLSAGKHALAHDTFSKVLSMSIDNPTALFYLVKSAYAIKSFSIAERFLKSYMEQRPVNADLYYSLAGLQYQLGKYQEASLHLKKVFELQPHHKAGSDLKKMLNKVCEPLQQ